MSGRSCLLEKVLVMSWTWNGGFLDHEVYSDTEDGLVGG